MIRLLNESDYPRICEIWESAVRNTHDFLAEEDFLHYKEVLPSYFPHVRLAGWEEDGRLLGFIGTSADNIEALFVDNEARGKGIGKALLLHAINDLHIYKVDVNKKTARPWAFTNTWAIRSSRATSSIPKESPIRSSTSSGKRRKRLPAKAASPAFSFRRWGRLFSFCGPAHQFRSGGANSSTGRITSSIVRNFVRTSNPWSVLQASSIRAAF